MRPSFLHELLIVLCIGSSGWRSPLLGQWRVGVEVGSARFWGGSLDTGGDHTSFRPYRPTTFGIGLERQIGRYAVGLQAHYAQASLALEGPEATVSAEGAFTIVSISPEMTVRIATLGPGNQLRLHAGPLFELWDIIDQGARSRFGAQSSVSLDVPLGQRFSGVVLAGAAVTSSPFKEGELD
ncbi:MAG: hypothetical protein ABI785_12635, partial [Gemmatimonadales bacterium]